MAAYGSFSKPFNKQNIFLMGLKNRKFLLREDYSLFNTSSPHKPSFHHSILLHRIYNLFDLFIRNGPWNKRNKFYISTFQKNMQCSTTITFIKTFCDILRYTNHTFYSMVNMHHILCHVWCNYFMMMFDMLFFRLCLFVRYFIDATLVFLRIMSTCFFRFNYASVHNMI